MQNKLIDRVHKEQKEYYDSLAKQTPETIIRKSYETCWKDEFVYFIESAYIDDQTISFLLNLHNILDELYCEWLKTDFSISDVLRDVVYYMSRRY